MPPSRSARRPPPRDVHELRVRAHGLVGWTLDAIAEALGMRALGGGAKTKGKAGDLVERALGASGGAHAVHDFPALGVELKTIPVDEAGTPYESTFVCTVSLAEADAAQWRTSWARAKLSHVLFVPVVGSPKGPWSERRIGTPLFYRPTREQDAVLEADFDEIMGAIGAGRVEAVDARIGRVMQLRPKAADGSARTLARGSEGEAIATVPRGFYLRARFTAALLRDPAAVPPG